MSRWWSLVLLAVFGSDEHADAPPLWKRVRRRSDSGARTWRAGGVARRAAKKARRAGIGEQARPTVEQDLDAFDRVLAVHVRGTYLMSRAVAPAMLAQVASQARNLLGR